MRGPEHCLPSPGRFPGELSQVSAPGQAPGSSVQCHRVCPLTEHKGSVLQLLKAPPASFCTSHLGGVGRMLSRYFTLHVYKSRGVFFFVGFHFRQQVFFEQR